MNCTSCNRNIQEVTFRLNGGLCGPCKKGAIVCAKCGKTVFEHPKKNLSPYFCYSCSSQARADRQEAEIARDGLIDWLKVENQLVAAGEIALNRLLTTVPKEVFFALVVEICQNWAFELHMDSVSAHALRSGEDIWNYQSWEYSHISLSVGKELHDLNYRNYDFFEKQNLTGVKGHFLEASIRAGKAVCSSASVLAMVRTHNLISRIADEDGLDFFTKKNLNEG
jgi:hypothetical protein